MARDSQPIRIIYTLKHLAESYHLLSFLGPNCYSKLPVFGDPLTFIAGVVRLRFVPFLILVTIGKVSRYILIIMGVDWIVN